MSETNFKKLQKKSHKSLIYRLATFAFKNLLGANVVWIKVIRWLIEATRREVRHPGTQHNDTHQNDTQHNVTQHNDTRHNDTQHNDT